MFGISSIDVVNLAQRTAQNAGKRRKPSCNVWGCQKFRFMPNICCLIREESEWIVKDDPPAFLTKENSLFFIVVEVAKEVVWETRVKGVINRQFCIWSWVGEVLCFSPEMGRWCW